MLVQGAVDLPLLDEGPGDLQSGRRVLRGVLDRRVLEVRVVLQRFLQVADVVLTLRLGDLDAVLLRISVREFLQDQVAQFLGVLRVNGGTKYLPRDGCVRVTVDALRHRLALRVRLELRDQDRGTVEIRSRFRRRHRGIRRIRLAIELELGGAGRDPAARDSHDEVAPALAAARGQPDGRLCHADVAHEPQAVRRRREHEHLAASRAADHRPGHVGHDLLLPVAIEVDASVEIAGVPVAAERRAHGRAHRAVGYGLRRRRNRHVGRRRYRLCGRRRFACASRHERGGHWEESRRGPAHPGFLRHGVQVARAADNVTAAATR